MFAPARPLTSHCAPAMGACVRACSHHASACSSGRGCRSLREAIKRRETISEMKQDKLVNLRRMVALHERMHRLTQDRIEELEGAEKAAQSNLDYKTTLFDTFSEGLTVKQATLRKLETAVHDQTKRYEILSTRKSVAQYCLEARERQIKLLSEHVAGALEDRSKQKDAMVQFHQARVEQQEKEYKVQGNQEKKKEALLRQCFDGWVQFTADSKKANEIANESSTKKATKTIDKLTVELKTFEEPLQLLREKQKAHQRRAKQLLIPEGKLRKLMAEIDVQAQELEERLEAEAAQVSPRRGKLIAADRRKHQPSVRPCPIASTCSVPRACAP